MKTFQDASIKILLPDNVTETTILDAYASLEVVDGYAKSFDDLNDVPSSKVGHTGKVVAVNASENSLEYHPLTTTNGDGILNNLISLEVVVVDPDPIDNYGIIYTKLEDGYAELKYIDSYGNIIFLTKNGHSPSVIKQVNSIGLEASPGPLRSLIGSANEVVNVLCHQYTGDDGGGLFMWYDTLPAANDDGINIAVTGSSGGWVRIRDKADLINVRHFGCVPGIAFATQTSQFQAALTYALANANGIFIPSGTYYLTSVMLIPAGTLSFVIEGESRDDAILITSGAHNLFNIGELYPASACRNIQIRNLTLNGSSQGTNGFYIQNTYESIFENMYIHHFTNYAIYMYDLVIADSFIKIKTGNNTLGGVFIGGGLGCNANVFRECRISANLTGYGIRQVGLNSYMNSVIDNVMESNLIGISIVGYSNGNPVCWKIEGNYMANYTFDIEILGNAGNPLQGLWFNRNFVVYAPGYSPSTSWWGNLANIRNCQFKFNYIAKLNYYTWNVYSDCEFANNSSTNATARTEDPNP